jgi:hypothetical protein
MRDPVKPSQTAAGTPCIHAFVIGVGDYASPAVPPLEGAATSALAMADWLLNEQTGPGVARGSIDVLASRPAGVPVSWYGSVLAPPTLDNVLAAAEAWYARCAEDPANLAIFYFCGHGVELGGFRSLLLQDVDLSSVTNPFRKAIAFNQFVDGMRGCAPRQQLYVLDACRDLPLGLANWADDVPLGEPLVLLNKKAARNLAPRKHAVLHASAATQPAWQGATMGWFTECLLEVLKGAASSNDLSDNPSTYTISTRDVTEVIDYLVRNQFLAEPAGLQTPITGGEGAFVFHAPPTPIVPVIVTRAPASSGTRFEVTNGATKVASHAFVQPAPWRSRLPIGDYSITPEQRPALSVRVDVPAKKVELP